MGGNLLFWVRVQDGGMDAVLRNLAAMGLPLHAAPSGRRELLVLAQLADAGEAGEVARALADLEAVVSVACCPEPAA